MPPKHVFLLRHAEKPEDQSPHLSAQGFARASALALLFAPALSCSPRLSDNKLMTAQYAGTPAVSRFPRPDLLIATKHGTISNRPIETITPLAAALGLPISAEHEDDDFEVVAQHVLTHDKFSGKVVLICWHHGKLPRFARALGVRTPDPDPWPDDLFDRLWQLDFAANEPTLQNHQQRLLFGDHV